MLALDLAASHGPVGVLEELLEVVVHRIVTAGDPLDGRHRPDPRAQQVLVLVALGVAGNMDEDGAAADLDALAGDLPVLWVVGAMQLADAPSVVVLQRDLADGRVQEQAGASVLRAGTGGQEQAVVALVGCGLVVTGEHGVLLKDRVVAHLLAWTQVPVDRIQRLWRAPPPRACAWRDRSMNLPLDVREKRRPT
jgi:hypothetical protein